MVGTSSFLEVPIEEKDQSERVKIALRDAGNQLLLAQEDTTSLILPILKIETSKYQLSFEEELSFEPTMLVEAIASGFKKTSLPVNYRVEVIQCLDGEVAYSYEINASEEKTIIPCAGRFLPKGCYLINVRFLEDKFELLTLRGGSYVLLLTTLLLTFLAFRKRKIAISSQEKDTKHTTLGSFRFYPDQHKLVKEAVVIGLSKKECELLEIFIAKPNQVITRDELTKKVWEDNGVFVGRSLDTYISKLRKKLSQDTSIKLTNIHGVGYKLEVHSS